MLTDSGSRPFGVSDDIIKFSISETSNIWWYLCNRLSDRLRVWFYGRVFGDVGSNGPISDWTKGHHLGNFNQLMISLEQNFWKFVF